MDFLSHKKDLSGTESAHIIIFFSFETTPQPVTRTEKRNTHREKKTGHFIFAARACCCKGEERRERCPEIQESIVNLGSIVTLGIHRESRNPL